MSPRPVAGLADLRAYAVTRRPGVDLVLDGSAGADLGAAETDVPTADVHLYPDATALEAALAARLSVAPEAVVVTAGADEALQRISLAYLAPGRAIVLPVPTFPMFDRFARGRRARIDEVLWPAGTPFPVGDVIAAVTAATAVIAVVSPNNPTGAVATATDLAQIAAAAPDAVLLVDAAYQEYTDSDFTAAVLALPNALLVRTFSKAYGLAGLRVGYVVGPPALVAPLRLVAGPYQVARHSLAAAQARLQRGATMVAAQVAAVRQEREQLLAVARGLGAEAWPSQANFVLWKVADAAWVADALAGLGIAVRVFPGDDRLRGMVRITCPGDAARFQRLVAALRTALAPEALLFDLDGVVADVSGSYRAAIVATAAAFGVALTTAEIQARKQKGGANDDWALTCELLDAHGVRAALAEVTARFEQLYQGSAMVPGLRAHERPLAAPAFFANLARRLPLAIVTGRPRADALTFLERHGLLGCFATVVSRDDAALKPDPAPTALALARLSVTRAWMVGDTPDDIASAAGAGVVPLGIVAPGEDASASAAALLGRGAARVLSDLTALEALLP